MAINAMSKHAAVPRLPDLPAPPRRNGTAVERALRSNGGTAAIEFALVAVPFLFMVIGIMEVAWQLTTAAALDHGVSRAARFGVTGRATISGEPAQLTCRSQTIPWIVTQSTGGFLRSDRLIVSMGSYGSLAGMSGSAANGAGSGGQVVTYTVLYEQPFLTFAWLRYFGSGLVHQATIIVKNEPFDGTAGC